MRQGGARKTAAAGLVAALALALAAQGQDDRSLKDTLTRNQVEAEAALYETADGAHVFVLDRTREPPLLQFRNSFEIFVLARVPASRGDEILRTDAGDDLLRMTPLGAVTLYTRERPTGLPAARLAPADPLPDLGGIDLLDALDYLRNAAGGADIDAPPEASQAATIAAFAAASDADRASGDLLADAARVTAEALRRVKQAEGGHATIASLERIEFTYGDRAAARYAEDVLRVELISGAGYAGRPSSFLLADTLLAR